MRFRRLFLCLLVAGLLLVGLALLNNNWSIRPLSRAEFLGRLGNAMTASTEWTLSAGGPTAFITPGEPSALLRNSALVHMVVDCARTSGDQRLQSLAGLFFHVNLKPYSWGLLVDPSGHFERLPENLFRSLDNYQRWCLHAMVPTEYPLSAEDRADMFSPDKYRTGSATHQLFALYLYRKYNGANPDLDRLIRHIAVRIASEASIDFRVTDLYLQRIAFLLAAGQQDLVRRRWVERALDAQQSDGTWSYSWYGWQPTPYRFRFAEESSTSHPTAQGMWITYMLKYRYPQWIERNYQ